MSRHVLTASAGDLEFHANATWEAEQAYLDRAVPHHNVAKGINFTKEPLPPPPSFLSALAPQKAKSA